MMGRAQRIAPALVLAAGFGMIPGEAPFAATPSFDCGRAEGDVETMICADDGLAALDVKLAKTYAAALEGLDGAADREPATRRLKAMQRGWIKGRNDCWKANDKRGCIESSYLRREAELNARYMLIPGVAPVFFTCNDDPADEIAAYFFPTDLPSVRLERGDSVVAGMLTRTASGAKYEAEFGITFWNKSDEARVEWPRGTPFTCRIRR